MFKKFLTPRTAPRWLLALALALGTAGLVQAQSAPPGTASAAVTAVAPVASAVGAVPAGAASSVKPPGGDSAANPYGLRSVWAQGDRVAQATLLILAVMSMLSWYFIVAKLLAQRSLNTQALAANRVFASAEPLRKRIEALAPSNPLRVMAVSVLEAARRHASLGGQVDLASWLSQDIVRSVATLQMRSQEGLSVLATVGSTAPFVGLFGTVWGIYNALVTIGVSGQASIEKVAGPVGEALIMTALGLAVAVPAVLGYNWLVRRNRVLLHAVKGFASELHTQLLVDIDKRQRSAATPKDA